MEVTDSQQLDQLQFNEEGLLPAIVQDWRDGTVLMLGYMNREAVTETLRTELVCFWSRSRNTLWQKGETSGHRLLLKRIFVDCDRDTLVVKAEPVGPTCHTGNPSCFFTEIQPEGLVEEGKTTQAHGGILDRLYEIVVNRKLTPTTESYVSSLISGGSDRILKKISEEAGEVLLAAKNHKREEIIYEVADLLFHTVVALGYYDIPPEEIYRELAKRYGQSGLKKNKGSAKGE